MEANWKERILPAFEVRKNKAQKTAFIDMLRETYADRMRVEESGGLVENRNIVIGDPERAKIVCTAHYDTCARLPFPNFITPRNIFLYLLYQIGIAVLFLIPLFLLEALALFASRSLNPAFSFLLSEGILLLGLLAMLWIFLIGVPNPHTANDNTSGVVTVLTLADRMADRPDWAFILFDNEEIGLLGSAAYAAKHPEVKKNTMIVNFDCVSDGDRLLVLFSKKAEELPLYEALRSAAPAVFADSGKQIEICPKKGTIYPSDQANFRISAAVCALRESKTVGLYMDKIHTPKDTVFDEANIRLLSDLFSSVQA